MSVHHHTGHVIPQCRGAKCHRDADLIIAFENRDAQPFCFPCGNAVMYNAGGLEYPLEEYYTPAGSTVSQCDPYDSYKFTLFDPDNEDAFVCVDNEHAPGSSVYPTDDEHC